MYNIQHTNNYHVWEDIMCASDAKDCNVAML